MHMELCELAGRFLVMETNKRSWRAPAKIKFCDELMICRWNDTYKIKSIKIVSVMSAKHTGELVDTGKTHF